MWRAVFHALIGIYLRQERGRTLLTIVGIALGVAILVAINLAIDSAISGFKTTLRDVAGRATLTARGNGAGIDPKLLPLIAGQPGVLAASPLIGGEALLPGNSERTTRTLTILGVDLLGSTEPGDEQIRELKLELEPGRQFLEFFTDPRAIILPRTFADAQGLSLGESFELIAASKRLDFTLRGIISGGPMNTASSAIAVLDIAFADAMFDRQGRLDRIDLTTREGVDPDELIARLQDAVPPTVLIERPEARGEQVDRMLAAFRFNLNALGHISLLVGAFLIFNTMSIAVVRRAPAIGTLRAMGVRRGVIRGVFLFEGMMLGLIGGVFGLIVGVLLARGLLGTVTTAISINFVQMNEGSLTLRPSVMIAALGLGVLFALLAALGPANSAAATAPANTMRRGLIESRHGSLIGSAAWGVGFALLAGLLMLRERSPGLPWAGYGASFCIVMAFVSWARPLLAITTRCTRIPLTRLCGAEGLVAVAGTRGALGRAGIAISGLLVALGMAISIGVMVASFRDTVTVWMSQVLRADLYISPRPSTELAIPDPMPERVADLIASVSGVAAVDPFRMREIVIDGKPARLGGGSFDVVRYAGDFRILDGRRANEVLREARAKDQAIISEAFARKHGLGVGNQVAIPTPRGMREIEIAGVYYDYSTEQGYVIIDRALYRKLFDDRMIDSVAVYLAPGADFARTGEAIRSILAGDPTLPEIALRANTDLRDFTLRAFNRTFRITWVMQIIAIVIAVLGVTTTLMAQIIDRRDEIVMLRTLGIAGRRVTRIILIESGLIGLTGVLLGVPAGIVLSWILARVIMLQSFGWTIQFHVPWLLVSQLGLGVFAASLAAGMYPAREAGRMEINQNRAIGN